ncbi:hypothetical protein PIB30_050830 [Stylosanthes scabra]|uniref:PB1-like domain-containing protein n=1 Tax=Stylosanthes scabra TaxID=79078 RepID=A0ABU6VK15_9FABA|nr:hypothetical protein [Stylosanthes scabra]
MEIPRLRPVLRRPQELPRVVRFCVVSVSPSCIAVVRLKLCLATRQLIKVNRVARVEAVCFERSEKRNPPLKGMGDIFVVPIFQHGGSFVRNPLGELEYVNGLVERFEEMDLDYVNFGDMVKLFERLWYTKYKAVYWLVKNAPELETGLNELEGDAGASGQPINLDETTSSSEDGYESAEDEANKVASQPMPLAPATKRTREKQPIRRKATRKSSPSTEPPSSSQHAGPSVEILAAASAGTKSRIKFMKTPGLKQQ